MKSILFIHRILFAFQFAESSLVNGLYWETWYNGQKVSEDESGYIFYENKLLGVPRLRQLKVRNDSCTIHDDFRDTIMACYDAYDKGIEDRNPFGKLNGTAYVLLYYNFRIISC